MVVATTMMEEDMVVRQMVEVGMVVGMVVAMEEVAMVVEGMALVVEVGGWVTCANSIDKVPAVMAPNAASCISEEDERLAPEEEKIEVHQVKSVQSVN